MCPTAAAVRRSRRRSPVTRRFRSARLRRPFRSIRTASCGRPRAAARRGRRGRRQGLAVGGKKRLKGLPTVTTFREAGYPEVECDAVVGVLVPAKTPKDIISLLNREITAVVSPTEVQERLATLGFETDNVTPEELATFIKTEIPRWAAVIQAARIKVD